MTNQNEPAFSKPLTPHLPECDGWESEQRGLTAIEYAAIHLRVPASGTPWLDDMIRQRLRDEFAAKAMNGALSDPTVQDIQHYELSGWSYEIADAMLAERERREEKC